MFSNIYQKTYLPKTYLMKNYFVIEDSVHSSFRKGKRNPEGNTWHPVVEA